MYGMSVKDIAMEFLRFKGGIIGLLLLLLIVGMAVGAPILSEEEAGNRWYDLEYWTAKDLPKGVPPSWVGLIEGRSYAMTEVIEGSFPNPERFILATNVTYEMNYDVPPSDVVIRVKIAEAGNVSATASYFVRLNIYRPDGTVIERVLDFETTNRDLKLSLKSEDRSRAAIISFMKEFDPEGYERIINQGLTEVIDVVYILFSKAEENALLERAEPLKGEYIFEIEILRTDRNLQVESLKLLAMGSAYGIFGTDVNGRDIFVGIIWGARVALILGLVVAIVSVLIGVLYGTVSAYLGGWVDEILQRIQEFAISIPLLPLLLILAFYFQPTIWNLIILLIVFSWPGPVKTIRSMALQIREQLYITAAKAVGASTSRIVLRYIFPQILPYTFALVAFAVPGAILTEAGVSFLLGAQGVLEITWGRILSDAQEASAVLTGMWWWVLPPGFMIAISGLAFVLIGTALDRVLNPRLLR